jgi:hypothetical protein
MQIMATASGAGQSSTERADNQYLSQIPGTQETEIDPTGYATKIDVGVAIPWSYFVRVWKLRNPATDGAEAKAPDEAAVAAVRDEEVARIKKLVEPLVSTGAFADAKKGVVKDTRFYDFANETPEPSMAANLGEIVLGGGGGGGGGGGVSFGGGGLIKPIGLGVLAVVSLFFMFNIAKKASVREQLPSAEELAGVPPMLDSDGGDIIGEADEATPALEGMELDDDSLRRQQMLDQLNELAGRDPAELSGILRRWMRNQD